MTKKEYEVLDRWAESYDGTYKPTDSDNTLLGCQLQEKR